MPQHNSGCTHKAKQVTRNFEEPPVQPAIDIAKKGNSQELMEELRSKPLYIAPTTTQPGKKKLLHPAKIETRNTYLKHHQTWMSERSQGRRGAG